MNDDAEWTRIHGVMAAQLVKFQQKGGNLVHMSSPAAWVNLHSKCALEWWATWGQEVPELQKFAMKVVPLLIGSGPAERAWKDVDQILTKKRNRLHVQTFLDLLYVRTWLRRELTLVSDEESEVFKEWEIDLLRKASFYDGDVEPDEGAPRETRIFEDQVEAWEQNAIDGTGDGARIPLSRVRRDHAAKFRLNEKYKALHFVDKDPDGETGYYNGPENDNAAPRDEWEHRKIIGMIWENHRGWRLETKLCNNLTGESTNYLINESMIRMIKESPRNRNIRFRSSI